jgi:hypothetical protein
METHIKLQDLRQRVLRGDSPSAAEYKELLDDIRGDRVSVAETKKAKTSSVKEIDPDDIFGSL